MDQNGVQWEDKAEDLLAEIRAGKKAYSVFVTSDIYRRKQIKPEILESNLVNVGVNALIVQKSKIL